MDDDVVGENEEEMEKMNDLVLDHHLLLDV
jgi:hypothetical protein